MNIFELVLSDPNSYQQVRQDFSTAHQNWSAFKQSMKALFSSSPPSDSSFFLRAK